MCVCVCVSLGAFTQKYLASFQPPCTSDALRAFACSMHTNHVEPFYVVRMHISARKVWSVPEMVVEMKRETSWVVSAVAEQRLLHAKRSPFLNKTGKGLAPARFNHNSGYRIHAFD